MKCFGRNLNDHCCYIAGKPCPFLFQGMSKDFKWSCQLRQETGSWEAVIADPRYDTGEGSPGHAFQQMKIQMKQTASPDSNYRDIPIAP